MVSLEFFAADADPGCGCADGEGEEGVGVSTSLLTELRIGVEEMGGGCRGVGDGLGDEVFGHGVGWAFGEASRSWRWVGGWLGGGRGRTNVVHRCSVVETWHRAAVGSIHEIPTYQWKRELSRPLTLPSRRPDKAIMSG